MSARMSAPQLAALEVLVAADGDQVEASKRRTRSEPRPCVNTRAVRSLVDRGYARIHFRDPMFWSPYTHDERYSVTDVGREALAAALGVRSDTETGGGR
jgi:hypothetical protein